MSDDQHDGQEDAVDLSALDDASFDEVTPEQLAAVQQAVGGLQQGNLEDQLAGFVSEYPKYNDGEAAEAFVQEVQRRAQVLNAPHIAKSPEFYFQVAADLEREERIAAERYERSDEARIDRIFKQGGSRVLPFG